MDRGRDEIKKQKNWTPEIRGTKKDERTKTKKDTNDDDDPEGLEDPGSQYRGIFGIIPLQFLGTLPWLSHF